jgi:uncharacterized membrane protein YfcA
VESLTALEAAFAALVVAAACAVRGGAGFGGQAVAVPLLALVLPLPTALAAMVVLAVLSSAGHLRRDWRKIVWGEIRLLLPWSVLGVFAGLYVLEQLDMRALVKAFGAVVILYAFFVLATASRPIRIPARMLYPVGATMAVLAGAMGATFGAAAGPLYVIYLNCRQLDRDAFRVTITTILTVQGCLRIAGYARLGFYDQVTLTLVAGGIPLVLLGTAFGFWLVGRLNQRLFNLGIGALLVVSGTALLLK